MAKEWIKVKSAIEAQIDRIWFEEPLEVVAARNNIYPSGAGAHSASAGNLFYQIAANDALGWGLVQPAMTQAMGDETFSLEACKRMFVYMSHDIARRSGSFDRKGCDAAWLNQPVLWKLCRQMEDAFDSVETKEELKSLLWSWFNYVNAMSRWYTVAFHWDVVSTLAPSQTLADVRRTYELASETQQYMRKVSRQEID